MTVSHLQYTPLDEIPGIVEDLRRSFDSGLTHDLKFRKHQLRRLWELLEENQDAILKSLQADMRKPSGESMIGEIAPVKEEINYFLNNLDKLAAPRKVKPHYFLNSMDTNIIRKEPLGVVLVIGAWNYPYNLLLLPFIGALAAGNTVVLKPSEVSSHSAALITELIPRYLDSRAYKIVNGGVEETTEVLKHRFDHIFYTGNGAVGKIVMRAAANHLTPVTLELGGKSPCIIADDADINVVANRLAFGKFYNNGQTCIAPDYVLTTEEQKNKLIPAMANSIKNFFGENPQLSSDYGRIISERQFKRLEGILNDRKSGRVAIGGQTDKNDLYISPTVVVDVNPDVDPLMKDEIFGPILPVVTVRNLEDATRYVCAHDNPLALYVFTNDNNKAKFVLDNTRSGGALVNDCLMHILEPRLPFGGVGPSGTGAYHEEKSFNTFTHERSTMIKKLNLESVQTVRYPPYTEAKKNLLQKFLVSQPVFKKSFWGSIFKGAGVFALVAALVAVFVKKQ